jgi:hypothetical protein
MSAEDVRVRITDEVTVVATAATGPQGPPVALSSATPAPLGTAAAGAATAAAKGDHVHAMPSAADVGALPGSDAGFLPGERNYGDWLVGTTYPVGAVVHDHDGDGAVYVATTPNVGEQPSLSPGSWDVADPVTRGGVAVGAGAVSDIQGSASGFAAEAGPGGVAFGYATRAGEGGFAMGALARAGDHAIAIGQAASAPGDGDVVIGSGSGLITGTIDYNTSEVTAAALPGGFVDLPETVIASDPAADSLRLVNRAAGLAVRDETGTEVAVTVATDLATSSAVGSVGFRSTLLDSWWTALAARATAPVDVVVLGDSIAEQDTGTGTRAWPYHLSRRLNFKAQLASPSDQWRGAQTGVTQIPGSTTAAGSATNEAFGGRGLTMSNGQKATYTATMDGISIVYGKDPSYGSIEVRDGAGGTLLATITTTGTAKGGFVWTSGALTSASHTIEITSIGANRFSGWFVHNGNRAAGVRIWNGSRGGMGTDFFTASAVRGLDLIENMQPDLVILATGTNDAVAATYDTRMRALVAAVRAVAPTVPIAMWIPWQSAGFLGTDGVAVGRAIAADLDLVPIDASAAIGDVALESSRWLGVGPHPYTEGLFLLGDLAASVLAGDPLGEGIRRLTQATQSWSDGTNTTAVTSTSISVDSATAGVLLAPSGIQIGPTSGTGDTAILRTAAGTVSVGSPLSILFSAPDGVVVSGHRQTLNAQTGTSYVVALSDVSKLITRGSASASTQKWPSDATAAIPVGSIIPSLTVAAGTVTHSADAGATLITGSTTAMAQGKRVTGYKVAANTWLLS